MNVETLQAIMMMVSIAVAGLTTALGESTAIFCLVIGLVLLFANPFTVLLSAAG